MTVHNLADPTFVLRNGSAMLELPPGLSLAPTARGEHLTVPVPDIPGGGSATAHWIVRGDIEGEYVLGATYGATLEPFGRSVSLRGVMEEPLKVWGGSALQLTVEVDDEVGNGYPFHVRVGLEERRRRPRLQRGGRVAQGGSPRLHRAAAPAAGVPHDATRRRRHVLGRPVHRRARGERPRRPLAIVHQEDRGRRRPRRHDHHEAADPVDCRHAEDKLVRPPKRPIVFDFDGSRTASATTSSRPRTANTTSRRTPLPLRMFQSPARSSVSWRTAPRSGWRSPRFAPA